MTDTLRQAFLTPADEFTPVPFWFWNDDITEEGISEQLQDFADKGVMGVVLHPRIGIPEQLTYMSLSFMELLKVAVNEASRLGMSVILYDEAMYPSGSANGQVVASNPAFASRGLELREHSLSAGENNIAIELSKGETLVSVQAVQKLTAASVDLATVECLEAKDGHVTFTAPAAGEWSILLFVETFTHGSIRGIHFGQDDGEPNAPAAADLLNPDAVQQFIKLTHDVYYKTLEAFFGNTVIAMFTDEPDMLGRGHKKGLKPWTNDFLGEYVRHGNEESWLSALWFEVGDRTTSIRHDYKKTLNRRLRETYYRPISEWCMAHGIALTGHPAGSSDIGLLDDFHIPGQDVVWRWVGPEEEKGLEGVHSTAGKCSADAARHRGLRKNLNEFLGVCGKETDWALSPGDMKWYIDWLAVRGVNLFCPHAFYYSVDGKRRSHERPPDVGPNNSWWPYYRTYATYMKRLSWLLTDSPNTAKVAVLCDEDELPWVSPRTLFEHQIDFNYLETSLLEDKVTVTGGRLLIEEQRYTTLLIETVQDLSDTVVEKIRAFADQGGHIIVSERGPNVPGAVRYANEDELLVQLSQWDVATVTLTPASPGIRVSRVKKEGAFLYLLTNEGDEAYEGAVALPDNGKVEQWNSWTGTMIEVGVKNGAVSLNLPVRESLIIVVDPDNESIRRHEQTVSIAEPVVQHLNAGWSVATPMFDKGEIALTSWTTWEGMERFSGTVAYECDFSLDSVDDVPQLELDLGQVHDIAQVFINGYEVGVKMWAPYRFGIDGALLREGSNTLAIHVTNTMANQMDDAMLPSGLLGPVRLVVGGEPETNLEAIKL
ncbi:glycosyl hydrolase [Aureibacillus halotolerans]|uniref:Alpha-L-rhamnosidase-like protein n=1 Tax=Aureibacillus halotolerans TaxID=1508390 RepID=A0A4R6TWS8_9BACI|nr:glycosyl hydrolase [Aureibacillus halotolerans]TDQ38318.1 alpha-L-rhamnosidase-like protein [Aureibacillus halotolerans]